jgi:hypothetical protein
VPERPNTTSSSRARTRPWWSRVRSTIPVTARSLRWRPGFQMCSSTPSELTPARRAGSLTRRSITGRTASQTVCQSTPSRRATAATLVSSHPSAATAQSTARAVSRAAAGSPGGPRSGTPWRIRGSDSARPACATARWRLRRSRARRGLGAVVGRGPPPWPRTLRTAVGWDRFFTPAATRRKRAPFWRVRPITRTRAAR